MDMKIIRIDGNDWICGYIAGEDGTISKYIELVTFTALPGEPAALPGSFALLQNYPNPFNPGTVISYQLPARAEVSLKIFNLLGQEVRTLVNRSRDAGFYRHDWDGRDAAGNTVSSGVYFYRMEATA
ncbi:MAG: T9SS type A sorting domain-containing protein, partial [Calditrichaeota bacterium]|nr:T9SS type A sorting domain-containing protein [Calditrichota bacterium]